MNIEYNAPTDCGVGGEGGGGYSDRYVQKRWLQT
jgi:hypothetical protein